MTTIATDGRSMAGDGLTTMCGMVTGRAAVKVFRLGDGRLFGGCGDMGQVIAVRDWLNAGGDYRDRPSVSEDFGAVLLGPDGIENAGDTLRFTASEAPLAIGSGFELALGAMDAGASPEQAVRIASARDGRTGGAITVEVLA